MVGGEGGRSLGRKAVLAVLGRFLPRLEAADGGEVTSDWRSALPLADIASGGVEIEYILLTHSAC